MCQNAWRCAVDFQSCTPSELQIKTITNGINLRLFFDVLYMHIYIYIYISSIYHLYTTVIYFHLYIEYRSLMHCPCKTIYICHLWWSIPARHLPHLCSGALQVLVKPRRGWKEHGSLDGYEEYHGIIMGISENRTNNQGDPNDFKQTSSDSLRRCLKPIPKNLPLISPTRKVKQS